ncbi:hypothetical protein AAFC00_002408 [Neodothiora populina]|uniref:NAD(P)-binding protein n=1 Tax=Neodothiora populina TaxID=2781224 RepID=A0ABR3P6Y8_9PEZI
MSSENNNEQFKLENLFNVKDKVVVVSGGGSGIGLMATQAFAVNGAKVYIIGRTKEKLDKVAEVYGKDIPGQIVPLQGDITSKESIAAMVKEIESKEKCVCILVNNAGISSKTLQTEAKSAEEMKANLFDNADSTFEDWTETYRTNVPQCFFMTTAFLPLLAKATEHQYGFSGCVINTSSISGIVKTSQHHFAYNASKAATIHLTKMLASEIAANGIKVRVNTIAPGVFPSEMTADDSDDKQKSFVPAEKYHEKTSAMRPGNDRDMGNAMLFAATNQYLNAGVVVVDGGYVLTQGAL